MAVNVPIHPGSILREDCLRALDMTVTEASFTFAGERELEASEAGRSDKPRIRLAAIDIIRN